MSKGTDLLQIGQFAAPSAGASSSLSMPALHTEKGSTNITTNKFKQKYSLACDTIFTAKEKGRSTIIIVMLTSQYNKCKKHFMEKMGKSRVGKFKNKIVVWYSLACSN